MRSFNVTEETLWGDLFDDFTEAEHSCIRTSLGDQLLELVSERRVLAEGDTEQWEVSIFGCLPQETGAELYISGGVASLGLEELAEDEEACLRRLLRDTNVAKMVAAELPDASPEAVAAFEAFTLPIVGCIPEALGELFVSGMVAEIGELNEDEEACLRGLPSDPNVARMIAVDMPGDSPEAAAATEALGWLMVGCLPEAFRQAVLSEIVGDFGELTEDEEACVRGLLANIDMNEWLPGTLPDASPDDVQALQQFSLRLLFCVPRLLEADPPRGSDGSQDNSIVELFRIASPSVAFIQSTRGTGSGVLIEGGYIVTNHHVVWPNRAVRVVFPDGAEIEEVPVVGWDPMRDLAVLGPVTVLARPLELGDGEGLPLGSDVLLVGYPAEVERFPTPTITRGILSRLRQWERPGMTYLQTDAAITGGQSGGALFDSRGRVIGISTFGYRVFGLAASSADIGPVVERLIRGEPPSELGDRRPPVGGGSFEFDVDLAGFWDSRTFVLDASAGTVLAVEIDGQGDGWFSVSDPFGLALEVDDGYTGLERGAVELRTSGPHFLRMEIASSGPSSFDLVSNVRLRPFDDPDDGRSIQVGDTVAGSLDYTADWDVYILNLTAGETVRILTDSLNVDTAILVQFPDPADPRTVSDDDSGGGLGGTNAELAYRAETTGEYYIIVIDAERSGVGGYYLSVETAQPGSDPAVVVPSQQQGQDGLSDMMAVFEDPDGRFSIQAPKQWEEQGPDPSIGAIYHSMDPVSESHFFITTEDTSAIGLGDLTLAEYADLIESYVLMPAGFEDISRETVTTHQGESAIIFAASVGTERVVRIIYLFDDGTAVNIIYVLTESYFDVGEQLAGYSFDSFRVN